MVAVGSIVSVIAMMTVAFYLDDKEEVLFENKEEVLFENKLLSKLDFLEEE